MSVAKRAGYWIYERCKEEALKYNNRKDLKIHNSYIFRRIYRKGWLDIFNHMNKKELTYKTCKILSKKYNNRSDLKRNYESVYFKIKNEKWYELLSHMELLCKPRGYWTYEKCKEEALKYKKHKDMRNNLNGALSVIYNNKWLELLEHMEKQCKPRGYWTYEKCKECAGKCNSFKELKSKYGRALRLIYSNGWYELTSHIKHKGNWYKRMVYVYEFDDNSCYIGITYNINKRNYQHHYDKNSSVYKHINKYNINPKLIEKTDYIEVEHACELEGEILNNYAKNGWYILNKARTGGIGGNKILYSENECKEEALKYDNITDFRLKSSKYYNWCLKHHCLDYVTSHLNRNRSKIGYWDNKELCKEEALKYATRSYFQRSLPTAYKYSLKNDWLDEFFPK